MSKLSVAITPAQLHRYALDQRAYYDGSRQEERAIIFGARMEARAELDDALADTDSGIAEECIIEQRVPLLGLIKIKGGRKIYVEHHYNCEAEAHGIHVAFQWCSDPGCEERNAMLVRLYIGHRDTGIQAQYEASTGHWYQCTGRGNHGKNYACGGNWSSRKVATPPAIFNQLEEIMKNIRTEAQKQQRIAQAKASLEAAELMVLAQVQREHAAGYARQSCNPIYDGQAEICIGKAGMAGAFADRTEARAKLVLAEAGL